MDLHYCQVLISKKKKKIIAKFFTYILTKKKKNEKFTNTIQKTPTIIMSFNFDISK